MRLLLLILLLILTLSTVNAAQIEVTSELVNIAEPGKEALYKVTIFNKQSIDDTFIVSADEFATSPFSDVFEYISIDEKELYLLSKQSKSINVRIKVLKDAIPNKNYRTFIKVKSTKKPSLEVDHFLTVNVVSPKDLIIINSNLPNQIIPGRIVSFDLSLENVANIRLKDIKFTVETDIFKKEFVKSVIYEVPEKERINFDVNSDTKPGIYTLNVKAIHNRKIVGSLIQEFEIVSNPDIEEKIETDSGLLVDSIKLKKTNRGNVLTEESFLLRLTAFQRLVTRYSVEPTSIEGSKVEWKFNLAPNETFEILVVTDYRSLFILVAIIIIGLAILTFIMTRNVVIKKTVFKVKGEKGISEIKIMLHVKNRGNEVSSIVITDFLPTLIKPKKEEFGTLKPNKIERSDRAIRMSWKIPSLMKGEERIISYEVESKLPIVGKFTLPRAIVKYEKNNKMFTTSSNKVVFNSER